MPEISPEATNRKSSIDSYIFRKFYKENVYPEFGPKFIDYWYDKSLYGRINRKENTVLPITSTIKQIRSDGGTYMALNFVADAFLDLQRTFQSALMRNAIQDAGSVYSTLSPKAGWSNGDKTYLTYLRILDRIFIEEYLMNRNRMKKVRTFNRYLKYYIEFISERADIVPVTKTAFIISKYCSPMAGGLIIELNEADHAVDILKKDNYIDDPNFEVFRDTARKYGFMVDKNAPWRLTANLASPRMQKYAGKYGITYEPGSATDIFEKQYLEVYKQDIELLYGHIISSYKYFIQKFPVVKQTKLASIGSAEFNAAQYRPYFFRSKRTPFPVEESRKRYNRIFWFKLYFKLRLAENNIDIPEQKIEVYLRQLASANSLINPNDILAAINRKVIDLSPRRWWIKGITNKTKLDIIRLTSGC